MKLSPKHSMLPIMVLAFVGLSVTFLSFVFTSTTRWLILGLVLVYLLARGVLFKPYSRSGFAQVALVACLWTLATSLWSEQVSLTFMKSGALIFTTLAALAGGYCWVVEHRREHMLNFLAPLTLAALLAGVLGRFSTAAIVTSGRSVLYQGLVEGGPNMFGSMLAMCSPLIIWQLYLNWNTRYRRLWIGVVLLVIYYLLKASSRGAILAVLITAGAAMLHMSLGKRVQIAVFGTMVALIVFMSIPGAFDYVQHQYIYKNGGRTQGVLYTREAVWEESYAQAVKGGWIGGGYGVNIGSHKDFKGGLTAIGYGREKGNSQLAIAEETGLIGLVFYGIGMVLLFLPLLKALRRVPKGDERVLLLIVTGNLAGMTVHSIFEAWWVSPGSPEFSYFWIMCGVAIGLRETLRPGYRLPQGGLVPTDAMLTVKRGAAI